MNDTPETIRHQMEQTRSQLVEKLESLELQVSETIQSTGTSVNAAVGAVQSTVQSVSNAFDVRRQFDRHPWLILTGSVALGYMALKLLSRSGKEPQQQQGPAPSPEPSADNAGLGNEAPVESVATAADTAAVHESGLMRSSGHQLRSAAFGVLIGIVQDLASRAIPVVMDYLTESGKASASPTLNQDKARDDAEQLAEATGADRNGREVIQR